MPSFFEGIFGGGGAEQSKKKGSYGLGELRADVMKKAGDSFLFSQVDWLSTCDAVIVAIAGRKKHGFDGAEVAQLVLQFRRSDGCKAAKLSRQPDKLVRHLRQWLLTPAVALSVVFSSTDGDESVGTLATRALFEIARKGDAGSPSTAMVLLAIGTNIESDGTAVPQPLLHCAVLAGGGKQNLEMLEALCTVGEVDPNSLEYTANYEWSGLCACVEAAAYEATAKLIECGADPNLVLEARSGAVPCCALSLAALFGDSKHVRLLLEKGADPKLFNPRYELEPIYSALATAGKLSRPPTLKSTNYKEVVMTLIEARKSNLADFAPDNVIKTLFFPDDDASSDQQQQRLHPYVRGLFNLEDSPAAQRLLTPAQRQAHFQLQPPDANKICGSCLQCVCECDDFFAEDNITAPQRHREKSASHERLMSIVNDGDNFFGPDGPTLKRKTRVHVESAAGSWRLDNTCLMAGCM